MRTWFLATLIPTTSLAARCNSTRGGEDGHPVADRGAAGAGLTAAAWGIHNTVNENMASAARIHIAEKGYDPRRFAMLQRGTPARCTRFAWPRRWGLPAYLPAQRGCCLRLWPVGGGAPNGLRARLRHPLERMDWTLLNRII